MIVLALLLLIAAAAMVVFIVVTGSTGEIPLEWDDMNLAFAPSPLVLFLLGALTLLLAVLALGLLRAGTKRSTEKRRELKQLRRLQDERDSQADASREAVPAVADGDARDRKGHDVPGYSADPARYGDAGAARPMHAAPQPGGPPASGPVQPSPQRTQPGVQPPPPPGPRDPGSTTYDPR